MKIVRKKLCTNCEREISLSNFTLHSLKCKGKYIQTPTVCKFCKKEFNSPGARAGHEYRSHVGLQYQSVNAELGRKSTKRLGKIYRYQHSEKTKLFLSIQAKKNNLGGQFCGRHFWYEKDGSKIHMHSSYELRVAKILDENSIEWNRPTKPVLWADSNNKEHRYYADFFLPQYNLFLDPKNEYLIDKDQEKIFEVKKKINLQILTEQQLNWNSIEKLLVV